MINIYLIALGCSKNLVDAECMSTILRNDGFGIVDNIEDADVVIVNTCGFIESAKTEAIDTILAAADYKVPAGKVKKLIVTGCLSQRYPDEILKEMPEVDAVLGTSQYQDIANVVRDLLADSDAIRDVKEAGGMAHLLTERDISTSSYAWLKIGEGCLHRCAFCAIPLIRGPFKSRPMEDILKEARNIAARGIKEIVLAAQDTTNYGVDLYKKRALSELLHKLSLIEGIEVIRVMYGYMDGITDELIAEVRDNPKVAKYFDIPIQHGSDRILKLMKRHDSEELITSRLEKIRYEIPGVIIRTTVMVGFPGETDEDFDRMIANLSKWRFDRLGCFIFSPEEGTVAYSMEDQVEESVKEARNAVVYETQKKISDELSGLRVGTEAFVIIDSISEDGIFYKGRSYGEAPEDDPVIYVAAQDKELNIGDIYKVKIVECSDYDLTGVTI